MLFDFYYWLVIAVGALLSGWAAYRVRRTFSRFGRFTTRARLTGAAVAKSILRDNGIHDVSVEPVAGSLTDHYDPSTKTLRLSEPVYHDASLAAVGVAAHEVGHAIQHATGYAPLRFRSAWVPIAGLGGNLSMVVLLLAALLGGVATATGHTLAVLGVALFATTTVFTLVTLPVEFDASRRALAALRAGGYMTREELGGAKRVLDAAALTYVAAFATSLLQLLYWAHSLGLLGGGHREEGV